MRRLFLGLLNGLWNIGNFRHYRSFMAGLDDPRVTQEAILGRIIEENRTSRYGEEYGFDRIQSIHDFQARVPRVDYDTLLPWIERILDGEARVLTREPVLMLEKTGGSTAACKYIPYTATLRRQFTTAISAWMFDLYTSVPSLMTTAAYWSVSPSARHKELSRGGVPVGFEEDIEYFDPLERWLINRLLVVPGDLARVTPLEVNRYVTLRCLLGSRDLGLASVWNPTFLTLLVEALDRYGDDLIEDVRRGGIRLPARLCGGPMDRIADREVGSGNIIDLIGQRLVPDPVRARELEKIRRDGGLLAPHRVWPRLKVISCWTDGASRGFLPQVEHLFPGTPIQGKGLLATEGVVTIPLWGLEGGVPAVTSHFLEFVSTESPDALPITVESLEIGARYQVLLTTGGGLYRYALGDAVEVVGWHRSSPVLRFVGRTGNVSDLCGEKLAETFVTKVFESSMTGQGVRPSFAMLAPEMGSPPRYHLFVDLGGAPEGVDGSVSLDVLLGESMGMGSSTAAPADDRIIRFGRAIEAGLNENPQYAYCRRVGQLGPLTVVRLAGGTQARYLAACEALGQKPGAIKPTYLRPETGWLERLKPRV